MYTNLTRPFTENGIPSDYWLLLSLMRNGELYSRKELVEATSVRAFRTLQDEMLISEVDGMYAISTDGLAYFEYNKPEGALKRIPRTVKMWKTTVTKNNGDRTVLKFDNMKDAKEAAKVMVDSPIVKRVNIEPSAF